jgi:hypothetical protein
MPSRHAVLGLAASAFGAALLAAAPALAHHSFAMFDRQKQITLKGTVKEFQWTNPHSFIQIEAPDEKGVVNSYSIEMNSPNNLTRQGWKSTVLKPGDKVTLVMNPLRDGSRGGLFVSVMLPDGKVLGDPTRLPGFPTSAQAKPG